MLNYTGIRGWLISQSVRAYRAGRASSADTEEGKCTIISTFSEVLSSILKFYFPLSLAPKIESIKLVVVVQMESR